ncbi:MAG: ribonuclease Y [Pirellulaceae bacterium]|nr:ribonuclease Y [Pirellulaceae bacterium]
MLTLGAIAEVFWPFMALGVGLVAGVAATVAVSRLTGARTLNESRREAGRILKDARSEAETLAKQIELDARNELAKLRESFDKQANQQRDELKDLDRRLVKREDSLDRKLDTLAIKEKYLDDRESKLSGREKSVGAKEADLDRQIVEHKSLEERALQDRKQALLRITNMSQEEAKKETLRLVEHEVQHEAAQVIQREMERAEEDCKENALRITLQAIQRYATEQTVDSTVSTIPIPSDDMKGRVIGREGRNIRSFEKATGVDVIVDDTPGVVVVSCFDPIRRAVATEALQKLLEDGRIHPTRIEEVVELTNKSMEQRLVKFGRDACIESNIQGLHPRISEMIGRLYYRTSYGQNILRHSMEVAYLCQVIADELGLDGALGRRCGFLHDIGKAMDHEMEGTHPAIGMEFCKKYGEKEEVLNAIEGHHNDIPATSPFTPIVMAADAISGARPGARRETLEKYVRRLEELESIATSMGGVKQAFAVQAGREVRVIVDPENVDDANCVYIARNIAKRVSEEMTFPGEIRVTVLREMRTVEYAR